MLIHTAITEAEDTEVLTDILHTTQDMEDTMAAATTEDAAEQAATTTTEDTEVPAAIDELRTKK